MKQVVRLLLCLSSFFYNAVNAQNVGIGTASPNASAQLDVSSTTKGMLIPRMTSAQRNAIVLPAKGLMVYDNDSSAFAFYNGLGWRFFKTGISNAEAWSVKGNSGTGDSSFIGTTDNQPLRFKSYNVPAGLLSFSNTAYGLDALPLFSFASNNNTAMGSNALQKNTDGFQNTAVGFSALQKNTTGFDNVAIGPYAMDNNTTGYQNIAIGRDAMSAADSAAKDNIAIGLSALLYGSGNSNTAVGTGAMSFGKGYSNVAVGAGALNFNEVGHNTVAIGDSALFTNGLNISAPFYSQQNTAVGSKAMLNNTHGYDNTALGFEVMKDNVFGNFNTAVGSAALKEIHDGFKNVALGFEALSKNTGGSYNTAVGHLSMYRNINGNYNTVIGANADVSSGNLTNASAIGANAFVDQSNSMVLGSIAGQGTALENTKVGIGTTQPSSLFTVRGLENTTPLVNILQFGTQAPALKISASSGNNGGLELENTSIKVSGANKSVFQITANTGAGGNTSGNTLTIPATTFANAASDLLIVTPVYTNVYCNFPIGVWWDGARWNIFNQTQAPMPNGAVFNVMVVKQ
jgi:trimeric autotransporter adhesin